MTYCANCGAHRKELLKTAYGDFICEDCWDDYISTDAGKLEYLIGICNEDYPMSEFDADFLGEVAISWKKHSLMLNFTPEERFCIEEKARKLKLL
jgi:hypothetical protein